MQFKVAVYRIYIDQGAQLVACHAILYSPQPLGLLHPSAAKNRVLSLEGSSIVSSLH